MFLDSSGGSGWRWQDEEPEEPIKASGADLAWLLGFLATLIFCITIALGAHLTGQTAARDSFVILSLMATTGVFCVFTWMMYGDTIAKVVRKKRRGD